ncbi:DUF58 domain-containing protein [Sorangium sp. So ce1036]|uniref:DUF58 domain-containing protein n=1 Tax=Sorangium sp. So ce1036 TaxID=3133328 RepID=UPI003F002364
MGAEDRERGSPSGRPRGAERTDAAPRSAVRTSRPRRDRPRIEQRPLLPARREHAAPWTRWLLALRPPRKLKFTREGKYYLGITLGVGFAAINTGNNLLYLLLGMLLSLIVVSGVMSDLSLRHLTVTRRLPARAQVGRAHLVEIEVYNHKKRVPSYAIEVEDLRAGQPADKRCFFLKISPSSAQVAAYRRTPAKRGRDRHTGFRIATRFPFGLFEKSREVEAEGDLIIYPAVDPVRLPVEDAGRREGGASLSGRGGGDETFGLRPMRDGDDPRDIYWRKSTLRDQLVLRERTRETRPDVQIVVDTVRPAGEGDGFSQLLERRIREAASRAVAHLKRGDGVLVATTLGERARGDRNSGADEILRFLALLEAVDEGLVPEIRAERAARAALRQGAGPGPASGGRRASTSRTAS